MDHAFVFNDGFRCDASANVKKSEGATREDKHAPSIRNVTSARFEFETGIKLKSKSEDCRMLNISCYSVVMATLSTTAVSRWKLTIVCKSEMQEKLQVSVVEVADA